MSYPAHRLHGTHDIRLQITGNIPCVLKMGEECRMDFIERIFGIAPDGGSGALELMLFLIPIVILVAVWAWRARSTGR